MTSIDTPLNEVAHLLPSELAADLLGRSYPEQVAALNAARFFLTMVEHHGIILDPIELEERLTQIARSVLDVDDD